MTDNDLAWQADAACKDAPTDLFFQADRGYGTYRQARKYCAACTVKAECLAYGLDEEYGMFGGMTPQERMLWKRKQRAA